MPSRAPGAPMLLDEVLPAYDFVERHGVHVAASPERTWAALLDADIGRSAVIRVLMGMRSLPALFTARGRMRLRGRAGRAFTIRSLGESDFTRLAEREGEEIVLGIIGAFWKPTGNVCATTPERFRAPGEPGTAKGAWSFRVEPEGAGSCLTTETRVLCADPESRRSFGWYWTVVQPFSGWIRLEMLSIAKRAAERG